MEHISNPDFIAFAGKGISFNITNEKGKYLIQISGKVTPRLRKAVDKLQYSAMPMDWVARQIQLEL